MTYVTLAEVKKQVNIDEDFTDDDSLLTLYATMAEEYIQDYIGYSFDVYASTETVVDQETQIETEVTVYNVPSSLKVTILLFSAYFYAHRGEEDVKIPQAMFILLDNYRINHQYMYNANANRILWSDSINLPEDVEPEPEINQDEENGDGQIETQD
jgi:uncharacterized phage protein (predicted DNA packaging)